METSGGYFVTALTPPTPQPHQAPRRRSSARRRWVLLAVSCLALAGVATTVVESQAGGGPRPVLDVRPVVMPTTMLGQPLRSGPAEQAYEQQERPMLDKIFGSRPAAIARYSTTTGVFLVAGRGPVAGRPAGDVHSAAAQHETFGDITCANLMLEKKVAPMLDVCWYSTPTFGASLLITLGDVEPMAQVAAALDAAVPGMRDS